MRKILFRIAFVLIAVAVIALYIYDLTVNHVPPTKNLFRCGSIICICIAAFLRTFQTGSRGI